MRAPRPTRARARAERDLRGVGSGASTICAGSSPATSRCSRTPPPRSRASRPSGRATPGAPSKPLRRDAARAGAPRERLTRAVARPLGDRAQGRPGASSGRRRSASTSPAISTPRAAWARPRARSIRSLEAAGIPVALNNVASRLRKRATRPTPARSSTPTRIPSTWCTSTPTTWAGSPTGAAARTSATATRSATGSGNWRRSARSGCPSSSYVDEVWAASDFVRESFAAWSPVPVVRMPLPVVLPDVPAARTGALRICRRRGAVFLYMFDVSSQTERKNPRGAIAAFRRAAVRPRRGGAGAQVHQRGVRSRRRPHASTRRPTGLTCVLLDGYMDREELSALLATADCYVSPHRSEGFGLTMLESMSLGKPVIAHRVLRQHGLHDRREQLPARRTAWSTLERDYGPYMRGAVWADPDLDEAARLMRLVVEHPDEGRGPRDAAARDTSPANAHPAVTGAAVEDRLEAIARRRPVMRSAAHARSATIRVPWTIRRSDRAIRARDALARAERAPRASRATPSARPGERSRAPRTRIATSIASSSR